MKIGFSLGRCIRDVVDGVVDIDDIMVIISRTRIENKITLEQVIKQYIYRADYLEGRDPVKCIDVATKLWDAGKFHQPRNYGAYATIPGNANIWADVVPTGISTNPGVIEAWENYRTILALSGDVLYNPLLSTN